MDPGSARMRLDQYLATHVPDLTRSRLQSLIKARQVQVAGATIVEPSYRVNAGEQIALTLPPPVAAEPEAEAIALNIVFEDDDLIVIDKPAGMVVHPAAGNWSGTLVNALIAHCGDSLSGIGGVRRPGIVHRLDKDTSGLLAVAKTDAAHQGLAEQFAAHGRDGRLSRRYTAIVWGTPSRPYGTIDAPIGRAPNNRLKQAVQRRDGKEAITHFEVVEQFVRADGTPVATLVHCQLETGRTHQIRVHMAHIGHPLLGDPLYGKGFETKLVHLSQGAQDAVHALARQALHAGHLGFVHPRSGDEISLESPLPQDLQDLIEVLRKPL